MKRSWMVLNLVLLGSTVVASSGCAAHRFGTMESKRPPIERSAFEELSAAKRIGVAPLSFNNVRFRSSDGELTEDQAFEGKRDAKRASWDEDKKAMVEIFVGAVGATDLPFEVK